MSVFKEDQMKPGAMDRLRKMKAAMDADDGKGEVVTKSKVVVTRIIKGSNTFGGQVPPQHAQPATMRRLASLFSENDIGDCDICGNQDVAIVTVLRKIAVDEYVCADCVTRGAKYDDFEGFA